MKLSQLFSRFDKTFSFEFFPPKDEISAVDFGINIGKLLALNPSFVSVTYGAGGSTQDRTFDLVDYLNNRIGLNTVAHYTCVGADRQQIARDMEWLSSRAIENLFVLRGDPPKGESEFKVTPNGFAHASELAQFVGSRFDFVMGGAAYPDVHPEANSLQEDVRSLKIKEQAGISFFNTQLFFDNQRYFDLLDLAARLEVKSRIIPGIIPLTSYSQVNRFAKMSHAAIPSSFTDAIELYKQTPSKLYQLGMDFAIAQCKELLDRGAPGLHLYTLNKSRVTIELFETLKNDGYVR